MTRMMCLICVATLISNLPGMLVKLIDRESKYEALRLLGVLFYWSQFNMDFAIYAASNKQYREAYLLLVNDTLAVCWRGKRGASPSRLAVDQGNHQATSEL